MSSGAGQQNVGLELRQARSRLRLLTVLGLLLFTGLGARLVDLALLSAVPAAPERLADNPMENQTRRADIIDRRGRLIASDYPKVSVFADPAEVIDPDQTVKKLQTVLAGIKAESLVQRLGRKSRFVWIKRHITDRQQREIMRLGLPGVKFRTEYHRVYPQKALVSHLVGYVGVENQGLAGIEKSFEGRLTADGLYKGPARTHHRSRYPGSGAQRVVCSGQTVSGQGWQRARDRCGNGRSARFCEPARL